MFVLYSLLQVLLYWLTFQETRILQVCTSNGSLNLCIHAVFLLHADSGDRLPTPLNEYSKYTVPTLTELLLNDVVVKFVVI